MDKEIKIAIMGVYFGQMPCYFQLWLQSCQCNNNVDFFVFTDCIIQEVVPRNVRIIPMTLCEMERRASDVLKLSISLKTPYKCCDYKPLFGLIFNDYIREYDYWGHCDFDMIFGNLESFFEKFSLEKYDKFLPLGHLSLYKNTEEVNHRYKESGSYVNYYTVYTTEQSYGFDEMDGIASIYYKNNYSFFDKKIFADIDQKHRRFRLSEYCVPKSEKINYKNQIFLWENGRVYREWLGENELKREEFCYIHFQKRKRMCLNDVVANMQSFYVTKKGFFRKRLTTIKTINKYNHSNFTYLKKQKRLCLGLD